MLALHDVLIHEDVLTAQFACDLAACKGACCVQGEGGAPLKPEEVPILEEIRSAVDPFLRPEGRAVLDTVGVFARGPDGSLETPLVNGRECAYLHYGPDGTASCGIEQAHAAGAFAEIAPDFPKPVSCHLYPLRVSDFAGLRTLRYDRWAICAGGCVRGETEHIPLVAFVSAALEREFGASFAQELAELALAYAQSPERPASQ